MLIAGDSSLLWLPFAASRKVVSPAEGKRKLVGAVGIENNTERNFKDFEEMLGSAKTLKRNNGECEGILIGPSMAPHFFRDTEIPSPWVFRPLPKVSSRLRAQILRRGWQADA